MGLDIAIGIMVLLGAVRGWFRGFVLQAITLGAIVGSVYAADPIRDYARPYVVPYLNNVPAYLLDRMLWWISAVAAYIVTVCVASGAVKLYRKRPYGEPEPNHADQFAGLLLSAGKAAVVSAFLISGLDHYALSWVKQTTWANDLTRESIVLSWQEQYRPAEKIWTAAPVQHFVGHVKQMGIATPSTDGKPTPEAETPPVQTAESRPPRLDLPTLDPLDPRSPDFARKFDEEVRKLNHP